VKAKRKPPFNVETFLATVNGGRSISKYRKNQTIFRQGDPADSVFFIQDGKVKVYVVSEQGKEAVVALRNPHLCALQHDFEVLHELMRLLPATGTRAVAVSSDAEP